MKKMYTLNDWFHLLHKFALHFNGSSDASWRHRWAKGRVKVLRGRKLPERRGKNSYHSSRSLHFKPIKVDFSINILRMMECWFVLLMILSLLINEYTVLEIVQSGEVLHDCTTPCHPFSPNVDSLWVIRLKCPTTGTQWRQNGYVRWIFCWFNGNWNNEKTR